MIPLESLPGFRDWGSRVDALRDFAGPLWIHGEAGSGVSSLATRLGQLRGVPLLDGVDALPVAEVRGRLAEHPRTVLAGHDDPEHSHLVALAAGCLSFRVPTFEDDPASIALVLEVLALEEGMSEVPAALAALPCPGHLRGLKNRLLRWKLLGQLPESPGSRAETLALEHEDIATNLHALERLLLHRALRRSYGNRVEAAGRLGVSRRQLYLLIARHGDPVRGELPKDGGPKRLRKRHPSGS